MKLKSKYFLLGIVLTITMGCLGQGNTVSEQPQVTTRILFVLDASRSMSGKWQGESKYTIARNILSDILDSIKQVPNVEVALRVYGHTKNFPPQDCNDTRLEVPFSKDNVDQIKYRLKQLGPKGTSPIANSLLKTKDDFTDCENCRNIVVLITDGIEECGGDICEVSAALQKNGIILKPFIIGIGKDTHEAYDSAGQYFNASNKKQFTKALNIIITKVLSQTSLQINLLDKYNRPTESNVNMTFINKHTGEIAYNYVHTLNSKGRPDTLYVDHLVDYKIIINTVPKTVIDSVKLTEGKHTTVSAECRQGSLMVKLMGSSKSDFNPSIIINNEVYNGILNVQYLNENVKYLTGKYDITILTLPKIVLPEIDIESDNQTKIEIENPGIAVIQKSIKGYGSIYALDKDKQTWIIDFGSNSNTTESLYLQPGSYRLIFRSKFSTQSVTTSVNEFEIFSEKTTRIKL